MRQYAFLATAALLVVACSDDPTGPDDSISAAMRADAAESAGAVIAADIESMISTSTNTNALFTFGADLDTGGCTGTLGVFICLNSSGNIDGEARLTFRDAGGTQQDDFDGATTASASIDLGSDGTLSHGGFSLDYSAERDLQVSGMAGNEQSRTWTGNGTVTATSSLHDAQRSYSYTATTVYTSVVAPVSGASQNWPASGTATTSMNLEATGGPDDGETATITAVVTFNGTADVPIRIGNTTYVLDLETGVVTET